MTNFSRKQVEDILHEHCYSYSEAMVVLDINRQRLNRLLLQCRIPTVNRDGAKLLMKHDVHQLQKELQANRAKYGYKKT